MPFWNILYNFYSFEFLSRKWNCFNMHKYAITLYNFFDLDLKKLYNIRSLSTTKFWDTWNISVRKFSMALKMLREVNDCWIFKMLMRVIHTTNFIFIQKMFMVQKLISEKPTMILKKISGSFGSGKLNAIMGPSGNCF